MSLLKLRLTMIGTLSSIIGLSTLFLAVVLTLVGVGIIGIIAMVVILNVLQWLYAPKLIDRMYGVRELSEKEAPRLHSAMERICRKTGLKVPKLMLANLPIPNAFAYGSPLTGSQVAVTRGLLETLEGEEVEAVIGHELGHLKHRDVQVMMFVSVLPAIFFYIGYMLFLSSLFGGRGRNAGGAMLIGIAAMALYWVTNLLIMGLSRLREYYADRHSVEHVDDGARKLSEALSKIVVSTGRLAARHNGRVEGAGFRTLFISDPEKAHKDVGALVRSRILSDSRLVREVISKEITTAERIAELFSTHPNIVKRLRALKRIS